MNVLTKFSRPQKAAAILVAMGKPSASKLLKFFKQDELKGLIDAARLLKTIPQAELESIVAEFEAEFTEGAGLLDSGDKMDTILTETLSKDEMDAIMGVKKEEKVVDAPQPVWPQLEKIEPERVGAFLAGEHAQTASMLLSKLAPQTAANVLLTLDKSQRSEIIKRMVSLTAIPDAAIKIIENQIRARLLVETATKDVSAGHSRVANVLNELDKSKLEEVMTDLAESGSPDLDAIRKRLFAFEDIELLTQKARLTLFDGISTENVTLALRDAPPALLECILSSIGQRTRRMIESELGQGSEGVPVEDIMRARKMIASTAIRLAGEGAFELPQANGQQAA
ncbi:MAG TPA: flagellar motor switch protein FliG [Rhizobiaceae bacterium]|nr:flagellar motor switch protein FliG [Rhizobiaceae bacterium]